MVRFGFCGVLEDVDFCELLVGMAELLRKWRITLVTDQVLGNVAEPLF
jgi:hypothetical protein